MGTRLDELAGKSRVGALEANEAIVHYGAAATFIVNEQGWYFEKIWVKRP